MAFLSAVCVKTHPASFFAIVEDFGSASTFAANVAISGEVFSFFAIIMNFLNETNVAQQQ